MSHFTVMVVTDTSAEEELNAALQPFHEYECTGTEDEYVFHADMSDEVNEHMNTAVYAGKRKEGGDWDYEYNKENADKNLIDHTQSTFLKYYEMAGISQDKAVDDYFGYDKKDGKYVSYTNPNAQWDWWIVGGRWKGLLKAKEGADAKFGETGLMGSSYSNTGVDGCKACELDMDSMRIEAMEHRKSQWLKFHAEPEKSNDKMFRQYICGLPPAEECDSLEALLARPWHFSTYALVMDGKWYQKGEMGWWGMSSNEKDQGDWDAEFTALLQSLGDNKYITIVDCHI